MGRVYERMNVVDGDDNEPYRENTHSQSTKSEKFIFTNFEMLIKRTWAHFLSQHLY